MCVEPRPAGSTQAATHSKPAPLMVRIGVTWRSFLLSIACSLVGRVRGHSAAQFALLERPDGPSCLPAGPGLRLARRCLPTVRCHVHILSQTAFVLPASAVGLQGPPRCQCHRPVKLLSDKDWGYRERNSWSLARSIASLECLPCILSCSHPSSRTRRRRRRLRSVKRVAAWAISATFLPPLESQPMCVWSLRTCRNLNPSWSDPSYLHRPTASTVYFLTWTA